MKCTVTKSLKESRKRKNLTTYDVGKLAGVSQSHYCMIENGDRRPSVDAAKKIAQVLDVEWTMFFDAENEATEL